MKDVFDKVIATKKNDIKKYEIFENLKDIDEFYQIAVNRSNVLRCCPKIIAKELFKKKLMILIIHL